MTAGHKLEHTKSKEKGNFEIKMLLNSFLLFIAMLFKALLYVYLSFNMYSVIPIDTNAWSAYATDLFTVITPVLLVLCSSIIRKMLFLALKGKKYSTF
jgi:hypothetical protein